MLKGNAETAAYSTRRKLLFASSTGGIFVWNVAADGGLSLVLGSPFGAGSIDGVAVVEKGASTFVYGSEHAQDAVRGFRVNADGTLTELATSPSDTAATPYGLVAHGDNLFAACNGNGSGSFISAFKVQTNGSLKAAPNSPLQVGPNLGGEVVNAFTDPSGATLYVGDTSGNQIFGYRIKKANAALSPLPGSPTATGLYANFEGLAVTKGLVVTDGRNDTGVSDVQVLKRASNGRLRTLGDAQNSGVQVQYGTALTPDGKLLICAGSHADQLRTFRVNKVTGQLTPVDEKSAETGNLNRILVIKR